MPNPFKLNPPCLCRVLLRRRLKGRADKNVMDVIIKDIKAKGRLKTRYSRFSDDLFNGFKQKRRQSPNAATITALIVCIRFSAWSNTMPAGLSNTSSVTSTPFKPKVS